MSDLIPGYRKLPLKIKRVSDGVILALNPEDNTYSFVTSSMAKPYRYTYDRLMMGTDGPETIVSTDGEFQEVWE